MGLGEYELGSAPWGFDPPETAPPPRTVLPPQALYFDGKTADFPLDEEGHYVEVHPVDHRVEIALFTTFTKVPVAPDVGSTVASIPIQDDAAMTADADARVRTALRDLIAAGDIELVSVKAWAHPRWRAHVEVVYKNLQLPDQDPRTIAVG